MRDELLKVKNLHVEFKSREGMVRALRGVDLTIYQGETLGLVGESGCGKSMTARAILNMIPEPGCIAEGSVKLYRQQEEIELNKLSPDGEKIRRIRGKDIAMIFQEPMTSLSTVYTIGNQIIEAITLHQKLGQKEARERATEMLSLVGIPDAKRRLDTYPFQLSGGMRQRVMIAMALSCNPSLLIADEPTTALDVTIQAQILELLQRLQEEFRMSILLITHNLGVVAAISHRVAVMYLGQVIEESSTELLFENPKHPYTQGLLRSVPKVGEKAKEKLWAIKGNVPNPYFKVSGCPFHPRCPEFMPGICENNVPVLTEVAVDHKASCFLYPQVVAASDVKDTKASTVKGTG